MKKIIVNSLPKAGSHLVAKLLDIFGYKFSGGNFSSSTVYGRQQYIKSIIRGVFPWHAGVEVGLDIHACARATWINKELGRIKSGEYCGGHLPYSDYMNLLLKENNVFPLHVIRDPRDVLLSWAHYVPKTDWHYGREGLAGLALEDRVKKILYGYQSGVFYIESFPSILQRSIGWTEGGKAMDVKFENLVGPQGGGNIEAQNNAIRQIADYVGCVDVDVEKIAANLFGGTKVFRKGQVGSWKDELSAEMAAEVTNAIKPQILQMGYTP